MVFWVISFSSHIILCAWEDLLNNYQRSFCTSLTPLEIDGSEAGRTEGDYNLFDLIAEEDFSRVVLFLLQLLLFYIHGRFCGIIITGPFHFSYPTSKRWMQNHEGLRVIIISLIRLQGVGLIFLVQFCWKKSLT